MSLVGSLEDLGLGDILQIVSLSRKSGVLRLRHEAGEGRIVLQDGMVSGAAVKGQFEDTRELLLAEGRLSAADVDAAFRQMRSSGTSLADALATHALIDPDRLESLCRAGVESAVMEMFEWRAGEFTFEVRETVEPSEAVLIANPLSCQYIAMEATRKRDEVAHFGDEPFDDDDEMLFSGEEPQDRVEEVALGTLAQIESQEPDEQGDEDDNESTLSFGQPPPRELAAPPAESPVGATSGSDGVRGHLIAIDPDLGALEWLKAAVADLFERVHIFQRAEIGVDRIRHYLGRGVVPHVLVAGSANAERPGGAPELVSRLRALAPSMHIAVLFDVGQPPEVGFEAADAALFRPASPGTDADKWGPYEAAASGLRESLLPLLGGAPAALRAPEPQRDPALLRLKQTSDQLRNPSTDRDVLSLVLDFAAETFNRVAMFMLREDEVDAIAERGLGRAGGPSEGQLSAISFAHGELPEVFRRVLERRSAMVSSMLGEGDQRLALLLGSVAARQAYVAPIESGDCVAALLYGDNLPLSDSVPDTTALEIALHEAGMALDRVLLRRALAERAAGS